MRPTSGDILVHGEVVTNWSAARSREVGIETVFQDRALAVQQTITRYIFMGRDLTGRFGFLKAETQNADARDRLHLEGLLAQLYRRAVVGGRAAGCRHRPRDLQPV